MSEWIRVEDRLPEHGQHVLVWDGRNNSYCGIGDDEKGSIRMGDAVYFSGNEAWESMSFEYKKAWNNSIDEYLECGNSWDKWHGQGPCSFDKVTHWMPLPKPPKN